MFPLSIVSTHAFSRVRANLKKRGINVNHIKGYSIFIIVKSGWKAMENVRTLILRYLNTIPKHSYSKACVSELLLSKGNVAFVSMSYAFKTFRNSNSLYLMIVNTHRKKTRNRSSYYLHWKSILLYHSRIIALLCVKSLVNLSQMV